MSAEGVLRDILLQPVSLARVLAHHDGPGRGELRQAADLLRNAQTVILTGMGASLFACMPLEYYLAARGCRVVLAETAELLHYQVERCPGAVVVMVSRSGDTIEIKNLLAALNRKTATIGITNEPESCLARCADAVLLVTNHPDEFVAIQSYTGHLATLLLVGAAAVCREDEFRAGFDAALEQLPGLIQTCLDASANWREFFEGAAVVHLVGRGPSLASCAEGALLFNEVAKLPAIAQPAGLFRHGPVEVVDASFRALVFAPAGSTQRLNLDLAQDLASFGGRVCVVGPAQLLPDRPWVWNVPAASAELAPLLEVVPLQFAAWRLALWRGLVPGDFRYVARVTLDEARFQAQRA